MNILIDSIYSSLSLEVPGFRIPVGNQDNYFYDCKWGFSDFKKPLIAFVGKEVLSIRMQDFWNIPYYNRIGRMANTRIKHQAPNLVGIKNHMNTVASNTSLFGWCRVWDFFFQRRGWQFINVSLNEWSSTLQWIRHIELEQNIIFYVWCIE